MSTTTNSSTGVANATRCVCQQNFYHNVRPSGREDYCLPCPFGALCPEVKTLLSTVVSREGFWRSGKASSTFYACPTPETCVGGAILRTTDDQCFEGNAGILCATCAKHYVRSGGACTLCKDGGHGRDAMDADRRRHPVRGNAVVRAEPHQGSGRPRKRRVRQPHWDLLDGVVRHRKDAPKIPCKRRHPRCCGGRSQGPGVRIGGRQCGRSRWMYFEVAGACAFSGSCN